MPANAQSPAVTPSETWKDDPEPIHGWFSLTYANYLVVPRSVLQSMPVEWQQQFCTLLDEMRELFGELPWPHSYLVTARRSDGLFVRDQIPNYDRGRTKLTPPGELRERLDGN